jgi:hypothetical protein
MKESLRPWLVYYNVMRSGSKGEAKLPIRLEHLKGLARYWKLHKSYPGGPAAFWKSHNDVRTLVETLTSHAAAMGAVAAPGSGAAADDAPGIGASPATAAGGGGAVAAGAGGASTGGGSGSAGAGVGAGAGGVAGGGSPNRASGVDGGGGGGAGGAGDGAVAPAAADAAHKMKSNLKAGPVSKVAKAIEGRSHIRWGSDDVMEIGPDADSSDEEVPEVTPPSDASAPVPSPFRGRFQRTCSAHGRFDCRRLSRCLVGCFVDCMLGCVCHWLA